jgi:hypothetical protein
VGWITRDPSVVAQRLVPQKVGLGRVSLIDVSEKAGVLSTRVTVDGADSRDVWVELAPLLATRANFHREFKGLLDRPARISGVLEDVPTGVFSKTSVRLSRGETTINANAEVSTIWGIKLTIIAAKLYVR